MQTLTFRFSFRLLGWQIQQRKNNQTKNVTEMWTFDKSFPTDKYSIFRQIEQTDESTFEVQSWKKTIKLNLLLQIGFFVYQYAKLRMLQFYYDFAR